MPGGTNGALLKAYIPLSCWYADSFGLVRDVLQMFKASAACSSKASYRLTWNYLSMA